MLTCEIHLENGNPLSRENAQSSLEVAANAVILPEKMRKNNTIVSSNATPVEPVFVKSFR